MITTGGFSSVNLLREEATLKLSSLTNQDAIEIGKIATEIGIERKLPIALEVRIRDWVVYRACLSGSKPENDE